MKIAVPFYLDNISTINVEDVDEYNINFTEKHSFEDLMKFVSKFKDKRINIKPVMTKIDIENIKILSSISDNVYMRLDARDIVAEEYKDSDVKFFFDQPLYSWGLLEQALSLGVTDVYVSDDLVYQLDKVREVCDFKQCAMRIILNRIPISNFVGDSYKNPCIQIFTPRDYGLLNLYFDTAEFDCFDENNVYNWSAFEVLYRRWFKDHEWDGNMQLLNKDLYWEYYEQLYPQDLTQKKVNCSYMCNWVGCNRCYLAEASAKMKKEYFDELNKTANQ